MIGLALAACIGAVVLMGRRQAPTPPATLPPVQVAKAPPVLESSKPGETVPVPPAPEVPPPIAPVIAPSEKPEAGSASLASTNRPAAKKSKPPLTDPLAREALAWVGADADAEAYWIAAINDPSIPAGERKDLVEDLNEDGLPDPHHPTREDLPLLINRILLIEALAPQATDQVNADAFAEAYKDLLNLVQAADNGTAVR